MRTPVTAGAVAQTLEYMNGRPVRVLIVHDDPAMRRGLSESLGASGYAVDEARNGEDPIQTIHRRPADLVLLNVDMEGIGAIEACRRIRSTMPRIGILMITVRDSEEDAVKALEAGADDYIAKPFRVRELIARLNAVLRRLERVRGACVLNAGKLELDLDRCKLKKEGKEIHLSRIEFRLLEYLMKHKEVVLRHHTLLRAIWGPEYSHELEYLRTYIRLLRRKIEDVPTKPAYIVTENWLGYRFREPAERQTTLLAGAVGQRIDDALGKPSTKLTIGDSSSKRRNGSDVLVIDRTGRHGPK